MVGTGMFGARHLLVSLLFCCVGVGVVVGECVTSDVVLANSTFHISTVNVECSSGIQLQFQPGDLHAPELQVVANTTVTFVLDASLGNLRYAVSFGLTLSPNNVLDMSGDPLGLTVSESSKSTSSCFDYPAGLNGYDPSSSQIRRATAITNNTFTLFWSGPLTERNFTTTPCSLTWKVPIPDWNNYTQIYYFSTTWGVGVIPYPPRRIRIVNATAVATDAPTNAPATGMPTTAAPNTAAPSWNSSSSSSSSSSSTSSSSTSSSPSSLSSSSSSSSTGSSRPSNSSSTFNFSSSSSSSSSLNSTASPTPTVPSNPVSASAHTSVVPAVLAAVLALAAFPAQF